MVVFHKGVSEQQIRAYVQNQLQLPAAGTTSKQAKEPIGDQPAVFLKFVA